ncbi:MAG: hypothetical protein QME81_14450 [bacterium]|nr:hypothetical protein [bacterium]
MEGNSQDGRDKVSTVYYKNELRYIPGALARVVNVPLPCPINHFRSRGTEDVGAVLNRNMAGWLSTVW